MEIYRLSKNNKDSDEDPHEEEWELFNQIYNKIMNVK